MKFGPREAHRGARPRFEFHQSAVHSSDEDDFVAAPLALPTANTYKHTRFNLHKAGLETSVAGPSSRTTYVAGPSSPEKARPEPRHDIVWNKDPPPLEINTTNYAFLDPAYVHQLDTMDLDPTKRKRTASVRLFLSHLDLF
jgi:hypothetical protein